MAGTLIGADDKAWAVAGWMFDKALGDCAIRIEEGYPAFAERLRQAKTEIGPGYLDVTELTPAETRLFLEAALSSLSATKSAGPTSFAAPEFFDGYVARVEELVGFLVDHTKDADTL